MIVDKNRVDNHPIIAFKVNDRLEQEFLHGLANEEGLAACIKPNSHTRVYFEAATEQVNAPLKKAEPAFHIIAYRQHEIIAEAMLYTGSQKVAWPRVISQTQAKVSLFVKKNKHLSPVFKTAEKAKDEVPSRLQFAAELLESLDEACDEFKRQRL